MPQTNPPITIRGNAASLTLSGPAANVPGVEVSVVPTNGQYNLYAVFPKGFQIQPGQNIVVTVNTDNPRFPVLSVPVTPRVGVITQQPAMPPPRRTGFPSSAILANRPANSSNAPAPAPGSPIPLNPLHP